MQIRVLGAVEIVTADGAVVDPGAPKRRAVVAVLALAANQVVDADTLVTRVWGDEPPTHARTALHGHVSALRKLLAPHAARLTSRGSGYELIVPDGAVDALRFTELADRARQAADEEAVALLREALGLWLGPPLTGVASSLHLDATAVRLVDAHRRVVSDLARRLLDLGRPEDAAALLQDHLLADPLREDLAAMAMQALDRAGDRAAAFEVFGRTEAALQRELGVEPSESLAREHEQLVSGAPEDTGPAATPPAPPSVPPPPAPARPVPAQLPARDAGFHGREAELTRLDAHAPAGSGGAVVVLHGVVGVGKSALALRHAHRIAGEFPDGQLYADLGGGDAAGPVGPDAVLAGFLDALGAPDDARGSGVPTDRLAAQFRSLAAGRRLLVVLDNARDAAQVRPLLAPDCLTLVTSRRRMDALVIEQGAAHVELDVLGTDEATGLLAAALGAGARADARVGEGTDARALGDLAARCGGLPLALRLAVTSLITHPTWDAQQLADAIADDDTRCALLVTRENGVGALVAATAATVPPASARALDLLGLHPGLVVDRFAVAALLDTTPEGARERLEDLARAGLLVEGPTGRWRRHDLVRLHGRHRIADDPERPAAVARLVDYYRQAVTAAVRALDAQPAGPAEGADAGARPLPPLDDEDAARRWVATEETALHELARLAESTQDDAGRELAERARDLRRRPARRRRAVR
ncbi:AfsR/SARP family transcriptional regulator [Actinomycetospora aeridis]|uniref:AfsR/SARP family transcriptional regulator n=1 Tax=Actinomycetospora aeridis TaxID=3129231 RepID=A0ABU8N809_9PSEU